jgi:hypothetical protein
MKMMMKNAAIGAALAMLAMPAVAQHVEGDAHSAVSQWARQLAPPGSFWLDNQDDREIVRYTTPRDVRLCLPEPAPVSRVDKVIPLTVTWDQTNTAVLYPGNCLYFDARRVSVKPAGNLPRNTVLKGSVETEGALQS